MARRENPDAPSRPARYALLAVIVLSGAAWPVAARAEVVRIEILHREPYAGGAEFGATGAYESIRGIVHYAVDPSHPANRKIVDLDRAPRGPDGRVEFSADFDLLAPADPSRGNGALLYDVNNRGNRLAVDFFNGPRSGEGAAAEAGSGFLMRRGYSVLWCGWIGELLAGGGKLLLRAPIATDGGKEITGPVRFEMVCDAAAETLPLSRRDGHGSYAPTERGEADGRLTWRLREGDRRIPIPRAQWSLVRMPVPDADGGVAGTLPQIRLKLSGGFQPGYLYELVYEAKGPIVQGLGYAAVRDLVSFLRQAEGESPLLEGARRRAVRRTIAFGVSQSGRFLRNFLHLGFNDDEKDRKVFDALWPHVAGGGLGFFNHRFAQPTRHNAEHEEHLYPADRFPFAYGEDEDPFTGRREGIIPRDLPPGSLPLVFHTQSAAEYWHRSGSLVHTDPVGKRDVEVPGNVRIYAFGGTQHGPGSGPPSRGISQNLSNPADYRPFLRGLLVALDAWIRDGTSPPPSIYPRIADGTLVDPARYLEEFPTIPGVRPPETIQRPPFADFGPDFHGKGIISIEPPRVSGAYGVLVPRPDGLGNDQGTLLLPEVATPLATYTGWNLRARSAGAEGALVSLTGSYFPLPATRAERLAAGDPRPSIEELHGSFQGYRERFAAVCRDLQERRFLLEEDATRLIERSGESRARFAAVEPGAR
jgi:hypothetical protein